MNQQMGLFEGRHLRDEALQHVEQAAGSWSERAIEVVYQVALKRPFFAADDIWAAGLEKPREPRAMGPVMMRAVKRGYCERTDRTRPTSNATQHAQPIRIYRSRLFGEQA